MSGIAALSVGTRGLDASGTVDYAAAQRAGCRFTARYSAGAASAPSNPSHARNAAKLCQPDEIARAAAAGLRFLAIDEWYEARTAEGYSAGVADGKPVLDFWQSRHLAKGASIILNRDTGSDLSKLAATQQYFDGFNHALGGYYLGNAFYGPLPFIVGLSRSGHVRHGWIPGAASWFGPNVKISDSYAPPAHYSWDLWRPTPTQLAPATSYLVGHVHAAGAQLDSLMWQTANTLSAGCVCDEDRVLIAGYMGSHQEAAAGAGTPPPPHTTLHRSWPRYMRPDDYFGDEAGPAQSRGGYYPYEQPDVLALKARFWTLGYRGYDPARPHFGADFVDVVKAWGDKTGRSGAELGRVYEPAWDALFTW